MTDTTLTAKFLMELDESAFKASLHEAIADAVADAAEDLDVLGDSAEEVLENVEKIPEVIGETVDLTTQKIAAMIKVLQDGGIDELIESMATVDRSQSLASASANASANIGYDGQSKDVDTTIVNIEEKDRQTHTSKETNTQSREDAQKDKELQEQARKEQMEENKKMLSAMQSIQHVAQQGFNMGSGLLKGMFGFIEDIHQRMKVSSPLLQTIESLFQTAMTLFFMPLGNKLGELLIPAMMELVEDVVAIWDLFEGKTLGEMFDIAIDKGSEILSDYFSNIAAALKDQGGILGGIARVIETIANVADHLPDILDDILGAIGWTMDHLKEIASLLVSLYTLQYTLGITQMMVTTLSNMEVAGTTVGTVGAVGLISSVIAAIAAGAGTETLLSNWGMAEGGYVPPKEGGSVRILAEAGEGEYVIPESKMGEMGATYNITNNFYGYTTEELESKVNSVIGDQITNARLRSGF